MPQMNPLNWEALNIFSSTILLTLMVKIFFLSETKKNVTSITTKSW